MKKRSIFAGFLALVISVSMMSVTAFASNDAELAVDETANTVTVSTPAQFKAISEYSNSAADTEAYPRNFAKWTIVIADDLDMTGIQWQPLINFNGNMQGTLKADGTTPVISHLTVAVSEKAGLCANSATGKFSDLTIAESSFTNTNKSTGAYAGAFAANGFTSDFENCDVINTTVSGVRFVGGVVGYSYGDITDCDVANCTIESNTNAIGKLRGYGDNIGGIVGLLCEGKMTVSNCTVKDTEVIGLRQVGGIAGGVMYDNTIIKCTVSNTTIKATGTTSIIDPTATACAGGFVGQLASQAAGQPITVTGNTISGTSTVTGQVAGWAVGDANSRVVEGSAYDVSDNYCEITTSLESIGK